MHDVRDHDAGRPADEERGEEIAECQDEGERSSRKQAGKGKRKNDAEKGGAGAGAEVVGGFDEIAWDVFEGGVEGKEDEGRVDVSEHEDDGEGTVEEKADGFPGDVKVLEEAVEDALGSEDGFPGIAADEIANPERNDDELIEKIFAGAGVKGHEVGQRIPEEEGEKGDTGGDAHGAEEHFDVDGILEELGVILEIPFVDEEAIPNQPEAVSKHQGVRQEEEKADPEEGRGGDDCFVGA